MDDLAPCLIRTKAGKGASRLIIQSSSDDETRANTDRGVYPGCFENGDDCMLM